MQSKCCNAEIIKKAIEVNSRGATYKYKCSKCKKKCEKKCN